MNDELRERLHDEMIVPSDQLYIDCYIQRAFLKDPEFIQVLKSEFGASPNELDPYEEAFVIQENYGLSSNTVEWGNENLLNILKENVPEDYQKFLNYQSVYEQQQKEKEPSKKVTKLCDLER
ncbi:hypothetical protein FC756_16855 [Lysinibacillus mangiferihumi]|uniref:Uncharacterized protein n=1 Tax=Lysinibacillus mangiferihumi TaxID=1130819 RepID=A0A4U2YUV0_9BACI|nr:hypothetical protein [Lysinibacillus mangiferihumi]TKI65259.1 hypothetical protein FC756_16855 [Lysinibacillus mangiferihumi]